MLALNRGGIRTGEPRKNETTLEDWEFARETEMLQRGTGLQVVAREIKRVYLQGREKDAP